MTDEVEARKKPVEPSRARLLLPLLEVTAKHQINFGALYVSSDASQIILEFI